MSKVYAKRTDANQKALVKSLRQLPGVTVETDHDDILVGYHGATYWFEIKRPDALSRKTGKVLDSNKRDDQRRLDKTWTGHRAYAVTLEDVLKEMGIQ